MRKFGLFGLNRSKPPPVNPLFGGIAVGILLGLCISFLDDISLYDYFDRHIQIQRDNLPDAFFTHLPKHLTKRNPTFAVPPWLLCAILLVSGEGFKPEKQFAAIRDTWVKGCNQTFFFTDSQVLHRRFVDELPESMNILLVEGNSPLFLAEWTLVHNILLFLHEKAVMDDSNKKLEKWVLFTDGTSYVHTRNLRDLLSGIEQGIPLVIGRRQQENKHSLHSMLTHFLPSSISSNNWPKSASISTQGPIIFSQTAFHHLAKDCKAQPHGWPWPFSLGQSVFNGGIPRHTGRAIGGCSLRLGIALWDPESRPLIVTENLRNLFSNRVQTANSTTNKSSLANKSQQMAKCCSDRAIAFGQLNHKDQRLLDFSVRQLKVFGSNRS